MKQWQRLTLSQQIKLRTALGMLPSEFKQWAFENGFILSEERAENPMRAQKVPNTLEKHYQNLKKMNRLPKRGRKCQQ